MNVELQHPLQRAGATRKLGDRRLRHPSQGESLEATAARTCRSAGGTISQTYGVRSRHGFAKGYPVSEGARRRRPRRDAWPADGGLPGSDLDFMRAQHLDHYGIDLGVMNPLSPSGQGEQNPEFSAAHGVGDQRMADRSLDAPRAAPEGLDRRALRGRRGRARRDPPLRRRQATSCRCCCSAAPPRRSGGGATGRSTRPRSRPACPSASTCSATAAGR